MFFFMSRPMIYINGKKHWRENEKNMTEIENDFELNELGTPKVDAGDKKILKDKTVEQKMAELHRLAWKDEEKRSV